MLRTLELLESQPDDDTQLKDPKPVVAAVPSPRRRSPIDHDFFGDLLDKLIQGKKASPDFARAIAASPTKQPKKVDYASQILDKWGKQAPGGRIQG